MANITGLLTRINDAVYGKDMRAALYDAIKIVNDDFEANKAYVDGLVGALTGVLTPAVVQELPEAGQAGKMYFILDPDSTADNDFYDEYLWIDGAWELIGKTRLDLSDYYTKEEADGAFLSNAPGAVTFDNMANVTVQNDTNGHINENLLKIAPGTYPWYMTSPVDGNPAGLIPELWRKLNGIMSCMRALGFGDHPEEFAPAWTQADNALQGDLNAINEVVSGKISASAFESIEIVDEYPMTEEEGVLYLKRAAT
jgi:hypothetical protein